MQGWLVFLQNHDKNRKYPMVVAVHGGQASVLTAAWPKQFFNPVLLFNQGYFVLLPNPARKPLVKGHRLLKLRQPADDRVVQQVPSVSSESSLALGAVKAVTCADIPLGVV